MNRFPHVVKFPTFSKDMETVELVKLCTSVLSDFKDLVDELGAEVRKNLTGGKPAERIDALHKVRIANRDRNNELMDQWYTYLQDYRLELLEEPVLEFLPQEVHEGLSIVPERGMPREAENELTRAIQAVEDSFGEALNVEASKRSNRRISAKKKERAAHDRAATLLRKGSTSAKPL